MAQKNRKRKTIARSLGEFVGHIVRGAKTSVDDEGNEVIRREVSRNVEEEERNGVTLRRTTIEEVEIRAQKEDRDHQPSDDGDAPS